MYWILSNELVDEDNDADLCGDLSFGSSLEFEFDEGEKIEAKVPKALFKLSDKLSGKLTDHLSVDEIPGLVVSSKILDIFNGSCQENLQYFDLDILSEDGGLISSDYKIVNIVGLIDCIDIDKSDIEYFDDGDVEFINKLVLEDSKIPPNLNIFRLKRRSTLILISNKLKELFIENRISGCVFYRPEEYH